MYLDKRKHLIVPNKEVYENTAKLNLSLGVGYFSQDELKTLSAHVPSRLQVVLHFFVTCYYLLNKYNWS
jgi:hypothetical protein